MPDESNDDLIALTADIVSAHVSHNQVDRSELPALIVSVHAALTATTVPSEAKPQAKPIGATTLRKSLASPEHIISMIDGKPYKSLKRHLGQHGFTVESYRATFDLPGSYPMIAESYSKVRREISLKVGLGRKKTTEAVETVVEAAEKPIKKLSGAAAAAFAATLLGIEKPVAKRGRPPRQKAPTAE